MLLDLPTEIRLQIYKHLFHGQVVSAFPPQLPSVGSSNSNAGMTFVAPSGVIWSSGRMMNGPQTSKDEGGGGVTSEGRLHYRTTQRTELKYASGERGASEAGRQISVQNAARLQQATRELESGRVI